MIWHKCAQNSACIIFDISTVKERLVVTAGPCRQICRISPDEPVVNNNGFKLLTVFFLCFRYLVNNVVMHEMDLRLTYAVDSTLCNCMSTDN